VAETTEKNLINVPLYTPIDVARYLRAPVWDDAPPGEEESRTR
jgi:hypothetical protein